MNSDSHSFIVRVWREVANSSEELSVWRGSIEHVGRDRRIYFADLQAIVTFIQRQALWQGRRSCFHTLTQKLRRILPLRR